MGLIRRFALGGVGLTGLVVTAAAAPILWVETSCRGEEIPQAALPVLATPADRRAEGRSYLTYPEWHMVHAYEDMAATVAAGEAHRYPYIGQVAGFWSSFCAMNREAGRHGPVGFDARATIHTIGVSFAAEMALKGAYETTIGRLFAADAPTAQDEIETLMAGSYAAFLQQTPWYRFDFAGWRARLWEAEADSLRGWERRVGLGIEWTGKALYARATGAAAGAMGADETRMRVAVTGLDGNGLADLGEILRETGGGAVLDVERYRAFTGTVREVARRGGGFAWIAGNDEIMISMVGPEPVLTPGARALASVGRQGDPCHLVTLPVAELADLARALEAGPAHLEHVYDY